MHCVDVVVHHLGEGCVMRHGRAACVVSRGATVTRKVWMMDHGSHELPQRLRYAVMGFIVDESVE